MTDTLALRYSSESTQWELSNEYQHSRVYIAFNFLSPCALAERSHSFRRVTTVFKSNESCNSYTHPITFLSVYIWFVLRTHVLEPYLYSRGLRTHTLFVAYCSGHAGYTGFLQVGTWNVDYFSYSFQLAQQLLCPYRRWEFNPSTTIVPSYSGSFHLVQH